MAPFPWFDLAILAGLILVNGVFSMSELAIVSARTARLRLAAEKGSGAAKTALALAAVPGKFLATVQIGITLVAVIAGAFSGATMGEPVAQRLQFLGLSPHNASTLGYVLVIGLTTFFTLVVGELVPKQIALRNAVPIALVMARPMALFARVAAPFVWLLDTSSSLVLSALRVHHRGDHRLTAEELQMIFAEATRSGAIEEEERAILSGVMRLGDRAVRELMTPRTEVDWLDVGASEADIREAIARSPHSLLPVAEGSVDKTLGVVKTRDVLATLLAGRPVRLERLTKKAPVVPDQLDAMDALRILQSSGLGMAMVHDEYGHLDGIVTLADLLAAMAGTFASHQDEGEEPDLVEREDGSLLIAGAMGADAMAELLALDLPEDREFATAAGYVLYMLKHLPTEGEHFIDQGWRFEVVDMDGRKIDKLLVSEAEVSS
ncbi:MAG TPA: hemolysin family protein [Croceibacterium sp.]